MPDETCRAFDLVQPPDPEALHRFVVGGDPAPQTMNATEVKALGDPFAVLLLAPGRFPRSAEAVIEGLRAAVPKGHALKTMRTFIVGEGSQLPSTQETARVNRTLRFIVTLGRGPQGPDVFLSVGDPRDSSGVEVMAWKRGAGGFNFYRSTGDTAMWMFAGNSRDALRPNSRGKGPFESHPSGSLLMKELKEPWNNWHSSLANIPVTAFAKHDPRRRHDWFTKRDPGGAYALELEAARPAITRWAERRFSRLRERGGTIDRPRMIMEQILDTPTVNLVTSFRESRALRNADPIDLPATFFVDADGLSNTLGLAFPPFFSVTGKIYKRCLDKFNVHLDDGDRFRQKGDTHFCFLAPERAFEDQEVLREAIEIGLVSKRLAACLLMVDPWNPIFSERRRALLSHVPATATIAKRKSRFSAEMAAAILEAADQGPADTPEAEFAQRWRVGPRFTAPFNKILKRYYAAVEAKLKKQAGFEPYFQLAEERRQQFKQTMPIAQEFPLLLPRTNITATGRRMRSDGTVGRR
jgi:hypothetical protein